MEIRCPGCEHPIAVPEEIGTEDGSQTLRAITSVNCPNCGSVSLGDDLGRTASFQRTVDVELGRQIGHFVLKKRLGGGGFGTVWLAEDIRLGRQVAFKIPASLGTDAANLLHEAKTAASLRHPNIVSIYDVNSENGQAYIASEYIDGLTLRDLLSTGRPPIPRTIDLLIAVGQALQHAHEHGVVHRDIKPANILLNKQGQPFVADFGIAKRISADATISSEGQVIGTARYMSPEQASGKTRETDHRSDIYALGVLLFEMMIGDTPFRGNARAQLHQKMLEDPPAPRRLDPTLPKDLETICLKCLEREPSKRYQTAAAVVDELMRFRAGDPIQARPISAVERLWRRCRRYPVVTGLLLSLIISLSLGLLGVSFFGLKSKRSADLAQRSLYRAQMNMAASFLDKGDIAGVRRSLNRFGPDSGFGHLRGFEWFYFNTVTSRIFEVANQGDVIRDVAVSHDGEFCAACGKDGSIHVWESKSGKLIRTLFPAGGARSVAFSPINSQLAAGCADGIIRIWNPLKDDHVIQPMRHGAHVGLVRYSPNGKRLLAGGPQGAVRVWDLAKESLIAEQSSSMSGMKDARFSPDSEHVAIASGDGMIRVRKIGSKDIVHRYSPNLLVESIAFSDDGRTLVSGSSNGVLRIWNVADEMLVKTIQLLWSIGDLEFVKNSRILAIVSSGGDLHLFDVDAFREVNQISTHTLTIGAIDRSADGNVIAVGSGDGAVKLVRIAELTTPTVFWHNSNVRAMKFLPQRQQIVAASADGSLKIWDLATGKPQELGKPVDHPRTMLALQPNGNLIAVGGGKSKVELWDRNTRQLVDTIDGTESGMVACDFSPSGRQFVAAPESGPILIYDSGNWRKPRLQIEKRNAKVSALAFSPNQNMIAVAYDNSEVRFFNTLNAKEQHALIKVSTVPLAACFCEQGRVLAIGTNTGEIHLWDLVTNQPRHVMKGHSGRINAFTVMPNGTTLISGGLDHDVKLWDTDTGERITLLEGHLRQVHCVAVSPDGNTIASGGLEGDLRIWQAKLER